MPSRCPRMISRRAFTIIEIVVIIMIIFLMLIIIVPHFMSQMKLKKAERVKNDLITLNAAIEHYALDSGQVGGVQPTYADLKKYLDPKSDIYQREGRDIFGDSYGPFIIGTPPKVPAETASRMSGIVSQDFWSPYQ